MPYRSVTVGPPPQDTRAISSFRLPARSAATRRTRNDPACGGTHAANVPSMTGVSDGGRIIRRRSGTAASAYSRLQLSKLRSSAVPFNTTAPPSFTTPIPALRFNRERMILRFFAVPPQAVPPDAAGALYARYFPLGEKAAAASPGTGRTTEPAATPGRMVKTPLSSSSAVRKPSSSPIHLKLPYRYENRSFSRVVF